MVDFILFLKKREFVGVIWVPIYIGISYTYDKVTKI